MDLNEYRENSSSLSSNVYFSNIKNNLIKYLNYATKVYGCVAWLTDKDILTKLLDIPCTIIVQEEDWESPSRRDTYNRYQELSPVPFSYFKQCEARLTCKIENYNEKSIRSIGIVNNPSRMHHKFLIIENQDKSIGVWTGSFNITENASNSLENAIYIEDRKTIREFFNEFILLYCLSRELKEEWIPNKYYVLNTSIPSEDHTSRIYKPDGLEDWVLVEERTANKKDVLIFNSSSHENKDTYLQMFGKMLYFGVKLVLEVKICSRCGRNNHNSSRCYARRHINGKLLR